VVLVASLIIILVIGRTALNVVMSLVLGRGLKLTTRDGRAEQGVTLSLASVCKVHVEGTKGVVVLLELGSGKSTGSGECVGLVRLGVLEELGLDGKVLGNALGGGAVNSPRASKHRLVQ
jgi:hypothetical protein